MGMIWRSAHFERRVDGWWYIKGGDISGEHFDGMIRSGVRILALSKLKNIKASQWRFIDT